MTEANEKRLNELKVLITELSEKLDETKLILQQWRDASSQLSQRAAEARAENQSKGRGVGGMLLGSKYRAATRRAAARSNAEISKKVDDAVLLIAGKSRGLEFMEYQAAFFESINNSPVTDKIIVLRGQFPQKTFDTIVSAGDIVVLPYEKSGQSGILTQCYAFNKPVVVSDLPAFKRSLKRSRGGLIAANDRELAEHITKLLQDDQYRNGLQNNIRDYVDKDVSWNHAAERHIEVYQTVVKVPYGRARHVFWE